MSETTELPTIREIERLWYELQNEMIAGGDVVKFTTTVIDVDGETSECEVTRVGLFNAVCDGKYLEFASSKGQYAFLPRQPAGRYTKSAKNLGSAAGGEQVKFGVDSTPNLTCSPPAACLLYTSPSPRDGLLSRMPSSA